MFAKRWSHRLWTLQSYLHLTDKLSQTRLLFSQTGQWDMAFSAEVAKDIEKHWRESVCQKPNQNETDKEKFYVLSMFPYPSGQLHMGHVRVYAISDAMARYHRLKGKQVIHPMGWDGFGLPAENAARDRGEDPHTWTYSNIRHMKKQLNQLGCLFDWDREFATCDPGYYKWTQSIFLRMYKAGLAYQKQAEVNWDPVDQTVLADEQIDDEGHSWRSGVKVERRFLRQWYLKTTAYAKSLVEGLEEVNPKMWGDVIKLQRHWLGDCTGTRYPFKIKFEGSELPEHLDIFTLQPELIYGVSFIAISPTHWLNQKQYYQNQEDFGSEKDCVLNLESIHPFTKHSVPVIVQRRTECEEDTNDSRLGIPCCNEEDKMVAGQFGFPLPNVLEEKDGETVLSQSQQFTGLTRSKAVEEITKFARENSFGGHMVSSKLNDWLISRQRYWGTPIPIIHCQKCKAVAVPEEDLPVLLPDSSSFHGNLITPLSEVEEWKNTVCPKCGGPAVRETDTMDTFVDSSWYFLRYLDPQNKTRPFDPHKVNAAMPVDLYIGGKEHAVLHLYFARYFCHFLHDEGLLTEREPFKDLLTQGMVMGQSYQEKSTGRYLPPDEVKGQGEDVVEKATGLPVDVKWEKMSKSKHNGVNPQEVLEKFGTDSTRLCILSDVAPKFERHWSNQAFVGITNWQKKVWSLMEDYLGACRHRNTTFNQSEEMRLFEEQIYDSRNYHLKEISYMMSTSYMLNTAIAKLQSYTKDLRKDNYPMELKVQSALYEQALADFIIMLSPFSPSFSSELWAGLTSVASLSNNYNWSGGVFDQNWPEVDMLYNIPLFVRLNNQHSLKKRLPRQQVEQLTSGNALDLVKTDPVYKGMLQPDTVTGLRLNITPGHSAELHIFVPTEIFKLLTINKKKTKGRKNKNSEELSKQTSVGVIRSPEETAKIL